ncbi:MAG: Gfo/Idh/MocA family oxidoreductase, partial [Sporichthyaceae bacterium]|nr:Gfo/Idh/MocA family oxidoreductase [Sporichthyaceae bacterium]
FVRHKEVRIHAVCTSSGLTSRHVADRYGARYCASAAAEILADPEVHAVLIATRHNLHASLTLDALRAAKSVFVEKPLALTEDSLAAVVEVAAAAGAPGLMVGFNRRFAPLAVQCAEFFGGRTRPLSLTYRVNAGALPVDSWILDPAVGGGRIVGEVCHFVDLICYLTGATPARIFAEQILPAGDRGRDRDAVSVTLRMSDGSLGTIQYLCNGDASVSKEYLEVFGGQRAAVLDNFRSLALHAGNRRRKRSLLNQAKGHAEEVEAFVRALASGTPMPIAPATLAAVTQTTFLIHQSLETGGVVPYEPPTRASGLT